jgi:hypothetical protein
VDLGFCYGLVLDTSRHDKELALVELDDAVTEVDGEAAAQNEEQFVLVLMVMPDELTFKLGELDVLAIEFADDARAPTFRQLPELLREVDLLSLVIAHARPPDGEDSAAGRQRRRPAYAMIVRLESEDGPALAGPAGRCHAPPHNVRPADWSDGVDAAGAALVPQCVIAQRE